MIEVTVKTLDSKNYSFSVPDEDITVYGFKEFIEKTVDIPSNIQRLIFAGRVLEDQNKLKDYGVQGNCIHLVTHAPPSNNPSQPSPPSPSLSNNRTRGRTFEFVGAGVRYPRNFDGTQNPPTSLAPGRLNVAKRMLREVERILNELDQIHQPSTEQENNPASQDSEEVNNSKKTDSEASTSRETSNANITNESRFLHEDNASSENIFEEPSNQDGSQASGASGSSSNTAPNGVRITEFGAALNNLNRLQARFAPYFEKYISFMQNDPEVPEQLWSQKQRLINRVSQILHYFGHAYHSISDMIVRVRSSAPRFLMCRPIILHHSILQPGLPIQLEAQFNFGAPSANETGSGTASNGNTANDLGTWLGFPILPTSGINIQRRRPTNNTSSASATTEASTQRVSNETSGVRSEFSSSNASQPIGISEDLGLGFRQVHPPSNNPNVEVYMELPTDLNDSDIPDAPDIIQTLMQAASQVITRGASVTLQPPSTLNAASSTSEPLTASSQPSATRTTTQARTNTQTQPTTATHTRSTARPQVQFSQHITSNFDPLLPCNSHHLGRGSSNFDDDFNTNTINETTNQSNTSRSVINDQESTTTNPIEPNHLVYNFTHNFFTSVRLNQGDTLEVATPSSTSSDPTNQPQVIDANQPAPGTSSGITSQQIEDEEMPLQSSSEQNEWQKKIPEAWVPILTRDSQNQKKMKSQPPFSDAYLSTMPSKRRKIINDSKFPPHNDLPELISASLQNAITESGIDITNSSVRNAVISIGQDETFQSAFEDNLRSAVHTRLRDTEDFPREQFPNAAEYFMGYHS